MGSSGRGGTGLRLRATGHMVRLDAGRGDRGLGCGFEVEGGEVHLALGEDVDG